jgi:hypothetical protein
MTVNDGRNPDWWRRNAVPACPAEGERQRFTVSIREWHPDYNVGDQVRPRGPLGQGMVGTVRGFDWAGSNLIATVDFDGGRQERFAASGYVLAAGR